MPSDGRPFGLPTMAEVREAEVQRRRLTAERQRRAKPWPTERPDPERLRVRWPDGERLVAAWRLARDLDTLADLLAGLPVDRDRLDPGAFEWAEERRLVQLRAPLELVNVATEARAA